MADAAAVHVDFLIDMALSMGQNLKQGFPPKRARSLERIRLLTYHNAAKLAIA